MLQALLKTLVVAIILTATHSHINAQLLSLDLKGGIITGTPYGEVPEGATGAPGFGITAGAQMGLNLSKSIGIRAGLMYSQKKSTYDSPISGTTRVSRSIFGINVPIPFDLSYEGRAMGEYDNQYLDIPFGLVINPGKRLSYTLGGYAAYLLEGSHTGTVDVQVINLINVNDEAFDQSNLIEKLDLGVMAGVDLRILNRISAFLNLQVGMKNVNRENPEGLEGIYRNIYLSAGLSYQLIKLL